METGKGTETRRLGLVAPFLQVKFAKGVRTGLPDSTPKRMTRR